ncbi:MAG: putative ABC transporter permease [Candidatus Ancillula sp.]|jgi:uncharacterized membrane protein|nr:putative ABC transporter permease [Candidatus Ancillula sp.]
MIKKIKGSIAGEVFRDIFLYFWFFSLIGEFIERFWAWFREEIWHNVDFSQHLITVEPLSPPYGIAMAMTVLMMRILTHNNIRDYLKEKTKFINILFEFIMCVILSAFVEGTSAIIIILVVGYNPFWDYSNVPFNFFGLFALHNCVLFGIVLVLAIRALLPTTEKWLANIPNKMKWRIFNVLFIMFCLDLLLAGVKVFIV